MLLTNKFTRCYTTTEIKKQIRRRNMKFVSWLRYINSLLNPNKQERR